MKKVIIPKVNEQDVMIEDEYKDQIEIIPVSHISEVLDHALVERDGKKGVLDKIKSLASDIDVDAAGQPSPQGG